MSTLITQTLLSHAGLSTFETLSLNPNSFNAAPFNSMYFLSLSAVHELHDRSPFMKVSGTRTFQNFVVLCYQSTVLLTFEPRVKWQNLPTIYLGLYSTAYVFPPEQPKSLRRNVIEKRLPNLRLIVTVIISIRRTFQIYNL